MKRIFLYTDTPIAGGAENHMLLLARELIKKGHDARIVCSTFKSLDFWCEKLKTANIPVIRLAAMHKHDPRQFWWLKKLLLREHPDILHVHLWNPGACRYAFMTVNQQKTKIVATEHDPFPLKGLKKLLKKRFLKKTARTIAISHHNAEKMLQWYPQLKNQISVIHNGIDLKDFEEKLATFSNNDLAALRKQLFRAKNDDFIITVIAALHPRKGLKYLIAALPGILKQKPKTKLVIAGEGPQKKELQKLVKKLALENKVTLLGQQINIPAILKSSDLFVLPSLKEAFGLVLLEAMAAQTPIIATKVGGIPEIVESGKSGLFVESADSDKLAEKIVCLMEHGDLRHKLALAGRQRVKQFSLQKMVEKTEFVYSVIS